MELAETSARVWQLKEEDLTYCMVIAKPAFEE
jgi:hypothetical protein